jgi:hypothetical protein
MLGAVPPFSEYVFMVWCLVKDRDNFVSKITPYQDFTLLHWFTFNVDSVCG